MVINRCIILVCSKDGIQLSSEDKGGWDIQQNVIYGLMGYPPTDWHLWHRFKFWLLKKILRKDIAFCKAGQ